MVVVMSQFRVANGLEPDVVRAFRERPHAVEQAPGFLWLEVFADASDPAVFYLLTRWADMQSYETWHGSPAHRDSHAFIPKGLKLDPAWTKIYRLERIEGHWLGALGLNSIVSFGAVMVAVIGAFALTYGDDSPVVALVIVVSTALLAVAASSHTGFAQAPAFPSAADVEFYRTSIEPMFMRGRGGTEPGFASCVSRAATRSCSAAAARRRLRSPRRASRSASCPGSPLAWAARPMPGYR